MRLAEVGVLDRLVTVSNEYGSRLYQIQTYFAHYNSCLLWVSSFYFQWVTWYSNKYNIWRDSDIQLYYWLRTVRISYSDL